MLKPESQEEYQKILASDTKHIRCLNFYASWASPCALIEQVIDVQSENDLPITFITIDVERIPELAAKFQVNSVPTVIFVVKDRIFKKIIGAQPEDIIETCTILSDPNFKVPEEISLNDRLKSLTNRHKLMIFIKGTPTAPKCGFTSTLLRHLANLHVEYDYFDILSDNDVRQGLKEYSNWPTYPQVYVNGELIGGLDIFTELMENGQLDEILVTIK